MTSQSQESTAARYELAFASALHQVPTVTVVVRRTAAQGPGGHPIYSDESGAVRAEISDRGECRMITTSPQQRLRRRVSCRPLPSAPETSGRSAA